MLLPTRTTTTRMVGALVAALLVTPAWEAVAADPAGSTLAERLPNEPVQAVYLMSVADFDKDGGTATIEPGGDREEVISYDGVDRNASALIGVTRAEPVRHAAGVFVAAHESEPQPSQSPSPSPSDSPSPEPTPEPSEEPSPSLPDRPRPDNDDDQALICADCGVTDAFWEGPSDYNSYFSTPLMNAYAGFISLGIDRERAGRLAFPPFIVAGPADWSDSWGAPRYGPGTVVRHHEGQDVFCTEGDPLLAADHGTVRFGNGGLGGKVARLFLEEGGYLYYAHLSDWSAELDSGDKVETGDVIGYCGDTGNAEGGAPHVHFGWYDGSGLPRDPMELLVGLLHKAERRSGRILSSLRRAAAKRADTAELERLFGDDLVSQPVELQGTVPDLEAATTLAFLEDLGLLPE